MHFKTIRVESSVPQSEFWSVSPFGKFAVKIQQATRLFTGLAVVWLAIQTMRCASAQDRGIEDFPKLSAKTDWPWWRGPNRNGVASDDAVPTKMSETENLSWKVPVPGRGHSSPIVVGNRVFLTTADEQKKVHSVLAFDRATGKSSI